MAEQTEQLELVKLIQGVTIAPDKQQEIYALINQFSEKLPIWKSQVDSIVITSPSQVRDMKLAKETRLAIRSTRLDFEKKVEEQRELAKSKMQQFKTEDDLWRRAFLLMETSIKSLESELQAKENFAKLWEAQNRAKLNEERKAALSDYAGFYTAPVELADLTADAFTQILQQAKDLKEADRVQKEQEAEQKRKDEEARKVAAAAEREQEIQRQVQIRLNATSVTAPVMNTVVPAKDLYVTYLQTLLAVPVPSVLDVKFTERVEGLKETIQNLINWADL